MSQHDQQLDLLVEKQETLQEIVFLLAGLDGLAGDFDEFFFFFNGIQWDFDEFFFLMGFSEILMRFL